MAFDTISEKHLIILDAYNGVFELNMENGEKKQIVSNKAVIGSSVRKTERLSCSLIKTQFFFRIRVLLKFSTPLQLQRMVTFTSLIRSLGKELTP